MMIDWKDFDKVEIRCGTILEVNEFPEARKAAWKLSIDFGEFGIKRSSAQITSLYKKSDLIGRQVMAVVNLLPKQIANFYSECLVLGLSDVNGDIVLLQADRKVENGSKIH